MTPDAIQLSEIESPATQVDGKSTELARNDSFSLYMDVISHFYRSDATRFALEDGNYSGNNLPVPLQPQLKVYYRGFLDALANDPCIQTDDKLSFMYPQIYFKKRNPSHNDLFRACAGAFVIAEAATSIWQPQQVRDIFGVTKDLYDQGVYDFFIEFNQAHNRRKIMELFPTAYRILHDLAYTPSGKGIIQITHKNSPSYRNFSTPGGVVFTDPVSFASIHHNGREG